MNEKEIFAAVEIYTEIYRGIEIKVYPTPKGFETVVFEKTHKPIKTRTLKLAIQEGRLLIDGYRFVYPETPNEGQSN